MAPHDQCVVLHPNETNYLCCDFCGMKYSLLVYTKTGIVSMFIFNTHKNQKLIYYQLLLLFYAKKTQNKSIMTSLLFIQMDQISLPK